LPFIGGESAGGYLAMLTALHLLQHLDPKVNNFSLKRLILRYGVYDLLFSPSISPFHKPKTLVLDLDMMLEYAKAFIPG
jgi:acetyl esterase/lipase